MALVAAALVLGGGGGAVVELARSRDGRARSAAAEPATTDGADRGDGRSSTTITLDRDDDGAANRRRRRSSPRRRLPRPPKSATTRPAVATTTPVTATEPAEPAVTTEAKAQAGPRQADARNRAGSRSRSSKPPPAPDTKAPVVTITSAPAATESTDGARGRLQGQREWRDLRVLARRGRLAACVSPAAPHGPRRSGPHTFSVRGTDRAETSAGRCRWAGRTRRPTQPPRS